MSTKVSNKDIAKAFKYAKKHLSETTDGCDQYICHVIKLGVGAGVISEYVREKCRKIINKRLSNFLFFSNWLYDIHPELRSAIREDSRLNQGRKMQETRRAWLDSLIKEFNT